MVSSFYVHITFQTSSEQPHREHEPVGDLSLNKEQKVKDGGGGLVKNLDDFKQQSGSMS